MPEPASRPAAAGDQPPYLHPAYRATRLRAPDRPLVPLPHTLTEVTGPCWATAGVGRARPRPDPPARRRAAGRADRGARAGVLDGDGRPVPDTLVEVWQANAAGRYRHDVDRHPAPLDPNFSGAGRCLTDAAGQLPVRHRQARAPTRGSNHHNAWRPAHIHFSVFGRAFTQRLVTQMYFPGDPLFAHDPIFNSVPDPAARERLVAGFDLDATEPEWALGYRFDIVLRGRAATPFEHERRPVSDAAGRTDPVADRRALLRRRPALARTARTWCPSRHPGRDLARGPVLRRRRRPGRRRADRDLAGRPTAGRHPARRRGAAGFGRLPAPTTTGRYAVRRPVKPGPVPGAGRRHPGAAPRPSRSSPAGCCDRVVTRVYFPDEAEANAADPVLAALPDEARATLVAAAGRRRATASTSAYRESGETVFFAV